MIRVENLVKHYGDVKAVRSISFEVKDGEILGFLGANGAGKSTTLKIMTGFLTPTAGNVYINDLNILDHSLDIRKQIGYLPELNPLYTEMKVYDLLEFVARVRGLEGRAFRQALERVIEQCSLQGVLHRSVGECSKGYKQRIGLASAIIHDPKILILDEPVTGLDPNQIVEIRQLIKQLGREKMVVISSHILQEIEATVDRLVIIHDGKIVADGTTESLMAEFQGQSQLSLTIKNAPEEQLTTLADVAPNLNIRKVTMENGLGQVVLEYDRDTDPREAVFRKIVDSGWILLEMSTKKAHLEELFRKLTVEGGAHA
ncbi:MAG: ATP-binding cassette domain-containing protein [Candidatus Neomarinimicrobiota bacterium]|nr:MAG: ATP-binding cassette domain-containing protein [Candidatus Neomarinimicrobiota bacterium]